MPRKISVSIEAKMEIEINDDNVEPYELMESLDLSKVQSHYYEPSAFTVEDANIMDFEIK